MNDQEKAWTRYRALRDAKTRLLELDMIDAWRALVPMEEEAWQDWETATAALRAGSEQRIAEARGA